jgi:hypothetical protein
MNRKQKKTLEDIIATPTRSDILWTDIESLFRSLGAEISPGSGSRRRCVLNGVKAVFHRPHPEPTTNKSTIEDVRRFLENAGVK